MVDKQIIRSQNLDSLGTA